MQKNSCFWSILFLFGGGGLQLVQQQCALLVPNQVVNQKRAQTRAFFRNRIPAEKSWFESYKITNCKQICNFWWRANLQLAISDFYSFWKEDTLQKKRFYSACWKTFFGIFNSLSKKGGFWMSEKQTKRCLVERKTENPKTLIRTL